MKSNLKTYSISFLLTGQVPVGETVIVRGWVRTRRDSRVGISFIHLYDGSCFATIQVIAPNTLSNYQTEVLGLTAGCSIIVTGQLTKSIGKEQDIEIRATTIQWVGGVEDPETYPISPKRHTLEYLREYAHLRPRTNIIGAVTRVQNSLAQAIHRFLHDRGFYWIRTPVITSNDCEGAGEVFRVSTLDLLNLPFKDKEQIDFNQDFFGQETFLTVSGQLQAEAYCEALSKVYTFGPAFRAEHSETSRHLAEFWMIEPEIAFADLQDNAMLAEDLLKEIFRVVLDECANDMAFFAEHVNPDCVKRLENLITSHFEHIDYTKAIDILQKSNETFEYPAAWGHDLQSEHERYLVEAYVNRPVVITNYPAEIKSFYMRLNDDQKTVAAMDILAPGMGEIAGGSQREERFDVLVKRLEAKGLNREIYEWYLDLRKYGTVPHAGFGIGFERLICYVTGIANIRDAIPFPRYLRHAAF
jgi:asparaginyl-tRNA synthetase